MLINCKNDNGHDNDNECLKCLTFNANNEKRKNIQERSPNESMSGEWIHNGAKQERIAKRKDT